jgi:alkylation response protein AidB-like acyl-CoA dehydrogenase
MDLELSDEQQFLRDAARDALGRIDTVAAARDVLEGGEAPDLWSTATEAGWPGLLVGEAGGGAELGAFEAMLIMQEAGRRLAGVPLVGHLPASVLIDAGGHGAVQAVAAGEQRAAFVPARPPNDLEPRWTVDPERGLARLDAPVVDDQGRLSGTVPWVLEAPGADLLVVVATRQGEPVAVVVEAGAQGVVVEDVRRYDGTRLLGHVRLTGAPGVVLEGVGPEALERAWHLGQALLAAESVGAVETCLEMSLAYAKERFTFGRPIGSYQAIKHGLTEVLRRLENARSLLYYTGWAYESGPTEFPTAANAARAAADHALGYATRETISVHGGIGATWEHDAPLFFRRAELTERLLGGTGEAEDRVAAELLTGALSADADPAGVTSGVTAGSAATAVDPSP